MRFAEAADAPLERGAYFENCHNTDSILYTSLALLHEKRCNSFQNEFNLM